MTSATHGLRGKVYQETWMHLCLLQFGMCAVCGRGIDEVYAFVIDHCHKTGIIRGLLCNDCNSRVGRYENEGNSYILIAQKYNPERVAMIRAYLTRVA